MQTKLTIAILATLGLGLAAPAAAQWHDPVQPIGWGGGYQGGGYDDGYYGNAGWNGNRANGRYGQWNGDDGYCRRSSGSTGTIVGAVAGGVIGNQVAKRRDKTVATVAGAVVGGLLGRSIDRGRTVCR
ncbi:glycine zipper 2TM domain-containing protein [Sandarakinorhabdus sp. AAP62]|uniref:glycine zipper 2TM domain-containing protein n=1 Tax=Sandarakinorhabdus sp. AAP62 TaxID=1248916 RepID=UPI0002DBCF97|nr:glycine zipper 2TM domain-containing protein [Sandarakinorhabdus sp. AAP62]